MNDLEQLVKRFDEYFPSGDFHQTTLVNILREQAKEICALSARLAKLEVMVAPEPLNSRIARFLSKQNALPLPQPAPVVEPGEFESVSFVEGEPMYSGLPVVSGDELEF